MEQDEKLLMLQTMTEETDQNTLAAYLNLAKMKILRRLYPFQPETAEMPEQYGANQVDIAAYLLNKRGAEGQTSHDENGINRKYGSADVPEEYYRGIVPFVGVVGGDTDAES